MPTIEPSFPGGLLDWAGHRAGGVRRLFDAGSGRPSGALIETALLQRLREWAGLVARAKAGTPRIVLLVGGPGNGKSEAVENTIRELENALAIDGELQAILRPLFMPTDGRTVPRLARVDFSKIPGCASKLSLTLVQDASVTDPLLPGKSAASLLVDDLANALVSGDQHVYLACVNRGVLDEALIHATDGRHQVPHALLESIVRAVATTSAAPPCWPLARFPAVAVWPMDVESLFVARSPTESIGSPASQVISLATAERRWPGLGTCAAGEKCPFCRSRALLGSDPHRESALRILRRYELATGKRWSFRDLFSLVSFLLAGSPPDDARVTSNPCEWAAALVELDEKGTGRPESRRLAAPFLLVASQYQHVLFGRWRKPAGGGIRAALRELKLDGHPTLLGLHHFLSRPRSASIPATLRGQLTGLCDALDPTFADPDLEVDVSTRNKVWLRDLDAAFSHSVREGFASVRKFHGLSPLETDLLSRLANADDELDAPTVRRRASTTARRLQMLVRDFASRLVRRSLGCRSGVVRDFSTLQEFELVVDGEEQLLHQAVRHVEGLLNKDERFVVALNTTFGEPLPPTHRRVVLTTAKQKVRPAKPAGVGRPDSDIRFLTVGSNTSTQSIPLTYELFRSVRELQRGMLAASLPGTVIALLDTTRARLAGGIVRDEELLDESAIRVGNRPDTIVRELGRFLIRKDGEQ